MKKKYEKPSLVVENFMVSDYIAACDNDITFAIECSNDLSGDAARLIELLMNAGGFSEGNSACTLDIPDGWESEYGMVCYHNTAGTILVFAS